MVEPNRGNAGAAVMGAGAGALAATLLLRRSASGATDGIVTLDENTIALLQAIGSNLATVTDLLQQLLGQGGGSPGVPGGNFGINQPYIKSMQFVCPVANTNFQLPEIPVPEGMQLVIKGWFSNGNLIYVSGVSQVMLNIHDSYPLAANEVVAYRVQNAKNIYVAAVVAGESVALTVEYAQKS